MSRVFWRDFRVWGYGVTGSGGNGGFGAFYGRRLPCLFPFDGVCYNTMSCCILFDGTGRDSVKLWRKDMFGRKKRDRWQEDGFPEEEYPDDVLPEDERLTDGPGTYAADGKWIGKPYTDKAAYGEWDDESGER